MVRLLVSVDLAFGSIFKDLGAEHVGVWWVIQFGVVQHWQGLANGRIFWVAGSDDQRCAGAHHAEDFLS